MNKAPVTEAACEDRPWKRALAWLVSLQESPRIRDPRLKRVVLLVALAFLIGGVVFSLKQQPEVLQAADWRPILLVVLAGIPITIFLAALEFIVTGRLIGQSVPLRRALDVTVVGTAANVLPLPGSVLVRIASLKLGGARYGEATVAVLFVGVSWVAIAFIYGGGFLLYLSADLAGGLFLGGGLVLLAGLVLFTIRVWGKTVSAGAVMAIKLGLVATDAWRLYLCLGAIGIPASFAQASALPVSTAVAAAIGFVPGGIGVQEALAAALSPLVGLTVASGFLSVTLNRILGLAVIAPVALHLAIRHRSAKASDGESS